MSRLELIQIWFYICNFIGLSVDLFFTIINKLKILLHSIRLIAFV